MWHLVIDSSAIVPTRLVKYPIKPNRFWRENSCISNWFPEQSLFAPHHIHARRRSATCHRPHGVHVRRWSERSSSKPVRFPKNCRILENQGPNRHIFRFRCSQRRRMCFVYVCMLKRVDLFFRLLKGCCVFKSTPIDFKRYQTEKIAYFLK